MSFADFIADILNSRNIQMNSDGSATRAFCYIADATVGFFTALLKGKNGEAYNIGNDQCEISIIDLAKKLINLFPDKGLTIIKKELFNDKKYLKSKTSRSCPNIAKIRSLGWNPSTSIESGFMMAIMSFM